MLFPSVQEGWICFLVHAVGGHPKFRHVMKPKHLFRSSIRPAAACRHFQPLRTIHLAVGLVAVLSPLAPAATRTWIGGNATWEDGGSTTNWTPADEPDADDDVVFNTDHIVNLGNSNSILSLALSAGIDLDTNTHDLTINGLLELVDSGTNLFIGDSASLVQADSVTINSNGEIRLEGGELRVVEETGKGLLHIKSGGTLFGRERLL